MCIFAIEMELNQMKCKPCEGGVPRLNRDEILEYSAKLSHAWDVVDDMKIVRDFEFSDYVSTIDFVNRVAVLAEEEGHHPVLHVFFSRLRVELWTHAIMGLSENDFILAAKINEL
jgi:4a-hydroxytetrahydrobiopterin dehydratase